MACRSCSQKKSGASKPKVNYTVMGNYANLTTAQINKRLEVFKRIYCKDCVDRYDCDYTMYDNCNRVNN